MLFSLLHCSPSRLRIFIALTPMLRHPRGAGRRSHTISDRLVRPMLADLVQS